MTGRIYNVPPEVSAVKVQVRTRTIHAFELLHVDGNDAVARITCEAGTYIRTMARDMGLLVGHPGVSEGTPSSIIGCFRPRSVRGHHGPTG